MSRPQDQFFYYLKPLLQQLNEVFPECAITKTLWDLKDHLASDVDRVALAWYQVMSRPDVADAVHRRDPTPLGEIDNEWIRKLDLATKITSDRLTAESRSTLWEYVDILTEYSRACHESPTTPATQSLVCASAPQPPPSTPTTGMTIPEEIRPMVGAMATIFESLIAQVPLPPGAQNVMKTVTGSIAIDIQEGRVDFAGWLQKAQQMANQVPEEELASMALQGAALKDTVLQNLGGQFPSNVGGATFETLLAGLLDPRPPAAPH